MLSSQHRLQTAVTVTRQLTRVNSKGRNGGSETPHMVAGDKTTCVVKNLQHHLCHKIKSNENMHSLQSQTVHSALDVLVDTVHRSLL